MADDPTTSPIAGRADPPTRELCAGDRFAGHLIRSEAGRGATGIVYAAEHERLGVVRALKVMNAGSAGVPGFRTRFERESRLAARLDHPNVVPVYEAAESEGALYISMRFIDGPDLSRHLDLTGTLPRAELVELIAQLASALDTAHGQGLVHRDVKPANVFLDQTQEQIRAFLGDFGISRLLAAPGELTETGEMLGTVGYVAPEQIAGEDVDGRADVYSLACVAYRALVGSAPFDRETRLATLFAHANAPRPRPSQAIPELGKAVDAVFARGLAVDRGERFASAGEFADALAVALAKQPRTRLPLRPPSRSAAAALAVGLLAAVVAIAAALGAFGGSDEGGGSAGSAAADGSSPAGSVSTVTLRDRPDGVAVGELNAWTSSADGHSVTAIVPARDGEAGNPIAIDGVPSAVIVAFGSTWIADRSGDAVLRLDPEAGADPLRIAVGSRPDDLAVTPTGLWVGNGGDGSVSLIDPETNEVADTVDVGKSVSSISVGEGGLWVADPVGKTVTELDAGSGQRIGNPIPVGTAPSSIAAGEGAVWVAGQDGQLLRLAPASGQLTDLDPGGSAAAVATGFGFVWVARSDGTLIRIDPSTLSPSGAPIPVGTRPSDVVAANGLVLVANTGDPTLTRIIPGELGGS